MVKCLPICLPEPLLWARDMCVLQSGLILSANLSMYASFVGDCHITGGLPSPIRGSNKNSQMLLWYLSHGRSVLDKLVEAVDMHFLTRPAENTHKGHIQQINAALHECPTLSSLISVS